jgi:hypothetical protein
VPSGSQFSDIETAQTRDLVVERPSIRHRRIDALVSSISSWSDWTSILATWVLMRTEVCLIRAPQRCRVLFQRGELIRATLNAIEAPQPGAPGSSDFENRCLSAAGKGCVIGIGVNPPAGPCQKPGAGEKRAEPRAPSNYPTPVPFRDAATPFDGLREAMM